MKRILIYLSHSAVCVRKARRNKTSVSYSRVDARIAVFNPSVGSQLGKSLHHDMLRLDPLSSRQGRKDKAPSLFLLECKRGGNPGLAILPTLILEENGEVTPEMLEIYGDYKQ